MSVLIAITQRDNSKLIAKLKAELPNMRIEEWPHCQDLNNIEFVLAWNAPSSMWEKLPNLKVVSSFGAGIDSIDLSLLPECVDVVRIIDKQLAEDMAEYVLTHVLAQKLRLKEYFIKQTHQIWQPKRAYRYNKVAILGYGQLGKACATKLINNGFSVSAWSQTQKHSDNVSLYYDKQGLDKMLNNTDYLVCLLPLTDATKGIINKTLLAKLPAHSTIINVARGAHVVEQDLLNALNKGDLRSATLDVFAEEPLANNHPYWQHSKITLTPHCAALSDLSCVIEQILHNIECFNKGVALNNRVDRMKGY